MEVNEALIDHIAHLSRLSFAGPQKEAIRQDMQRMIAFVDKLSELDTTGVEPLIFIDCATMKSHKALAMKKHCAMPLKKIQTILESLKY